MTARQSDVYPGEFCKCGCGKKLRGAGTSGYYVGHYPRTKESREKLSKSKTGKQGARHTPEWKDKMRARMSGENNPRYGVKWSEEERKRIAENLAALPKTEEWNRRISEAKKGKLPYPGALDVLAKFNRGGPSHSCWRGGISMLPYPPTFNKEFKAMIRQRDGGLCFICKKPGKDVHHINYVKDDTTPENCVTLCKKCHGETNHNRRTWQSILTSLMSVSRSLGNILNERHG